MVNLITKDFSRISFHDSSIEKIERDENASFRFTFDWVKLSNFSEAGISDSIVIGKNILFLEKISSEKYFKNIEGQREEIDYPKNFADEF